MNVLFDLDGTLTDPGDGFVACIGHALSRLECRSEDDRAKIRAAVAFYRDRYGTVGFKENTVYPGIEAGLMSFLLKAERLNAGSTAMVSDRSHDVVAALANGVRSVGALWGYGSREELSQAGAQVLCERPSQLSETLLSFGLAFT